MRAILASGGYSGFGWKINLADSTWPPTRMRLGACGVGGGGGGGAAAESTPPITPPSTPPNDPPGTPPGTPPTTPTAAGGGSFSALAIVRGMTVGARIISSALTRWITLGGGAAAGGGGGGGGGGGAARKVINCALGRASV